MLPWRDGVVPVGLEVMALNVEGSHFGIADFDALGIAALVDVASDGEAGIGGSGADELDDDVAIIPSQSAAGKSHARRRGGACIPGARLRTVPLIAAVAPRRQQRSVTRPVADRGGTSWIIGRRALRIRRGRTRQRVPSPRPLPSGVCGTRAWRSRDRAGAPVSDVGRAFPIEVGRGGGRLLVYASRPPQANN